MGPVGSWHLVGDRGLVPPLLVSWHLCGHREPHHEEGECHPKERSARPWLESRYGRRIGVPPGTPATVVGPLLEIVYKRRLAT